MMMTWRTSDERKWEATPMASVGEAADRLGRDAGRRRGLRPLSPRGAQPRAVLRLEEAALGLASPHLRGPERPARCPGATPGVRGPAAQERDRRDHRREPRPKKGALGLEDYGQLPPELQKRVHEEVQGARRRRGGRGGGTRGARGVAGGGSSRGLKEKAWARERPPDPPPPVSPYEALSEEKQAV